EWELRQLVSAFRRALDEPTSYLFTIFGTAGTGKSRLAREFTRGIAEEATVLSGRCLSYGEGITFWPIGEMLRQVDPADPVRGAEGNPLFLEQLLAMVRSDGVTPRELRVPPTIEALLAARLDRLDAGERELLEAAAVIGRDFSRRSVTALLPQGAHELVLDQA